LADRTEPSLAPLLIDGSGRDGTTLLMQLLSTSAEIAFDRTYPYEQRYFSYLLYWSRLPTGEGWDEATWNLDSLAHAELLREAPVVGPLPWMERSLISGNGGKEFWEEAFESTWAAFSARAREAIRERLGDPSLQVRYYAQKSADSWVLPFESIPDLRLLCLLRDPRDVWVSSVAFHRRRSAEGHGFLPIGEGESEHEMMLRFIADQRKRLQWLTRVEEERGAPLVRYESLVRDLPAETERIGEWLGLRLDAEAVARRRGEYSGHITAGSVEESVGRWRREMPDEVATLFWDSMGEELEQLGLER
jgi:hypothetical protein